MSGQRPLLFRSKHGPTERPVEGGSSLVVQERRRMDDLDLSCYQYYWSDCPT
jgi:hypothetical protein